MAKTCLQTRANRKFLAYALKPLDFINEHDQEMNYTQIIKGAWRNVLNYRALWVFGIILALVTFSWPSAALLGQDDQGSAARGLRIRPRSYETLPEAVERTLRYELDQVDRELEQYLYETLNLEVESDILTVIKVLVPVLFILYLAGKVARYVSETALIRMVDKHQETGQKQTVRQGFRLGWSRSAWRIFFIGLLVNLVAIAICLLLFALIFSPLPLWVEGGEGTVIIGAILTAAFFFLAIFLVVLIAAAVSMLKILARQTCAIEGLGVTASVYRGYALLRQNLKRVLPIGFVMLGINVIWPLLAGALLIMLLGIGILLGGLPALLINWLAGLAAAGKLAVIIAVSFGSLILILILAAPLFWLNGMRQVFLSSMWTLTYRALCQIEQLAQAAPPEVQTADTPLWDAGESDPQTAPPTP